MNKMCKRKHKMSLKCIKLFEPNLTENSNLTHGFNLKTIYFFEKLLSFLNSMNKNTLKKYI